MVSELDLGARTPGRLVGRRREEPRRRSRRPNPLRRGLSARIARAAGPPVRRAVPALPRPLRVDRPRNLLGPPRRPELAERVPLEARRVSAPVRPRSQAKASVQGGDGGAVNDRPRTASDGLRFRRPGREAVKESITEHGIRRADGGKERRIEGLRLRTPFSALFNPILSQTLSWPCSSQARSISDRVIIRALKRTLATARRKMTPAASPTWSSLTMTCPSCTRPGKGDIMLSLRDDTRNESRSGRKRTPLQQPRELLPRERSGTPAGPDQRSGRSARTGESRPGSGDRDEADGRRPGKKNRYRFRSTPIPVPKPQIHHPPWQKLPAVVICNPISLIAYA